MADRPDETWHRLRDWTQSRAVSERLAAQVLISEGYQDVDPSHPLGGRDGGKDALAARDNLKWVMAVHFVRGQQGFAATKKKFLEDLQGVAKNGADAFAFVTNQELRLTERAALTKAAAPTRVELYHLERITTILDKPTMARVRRQFLGIEIGSTWPDAAAADATLEELATQVEYEVAARVELLARQGDRMFVWLKPAATTSPPSADGVRRIVLAPACVLSAASGVTTLEVGLSDTSVMVGSNGEMQMGAWRVRFTVDDVGVVARTKKVDVDFWKRVTVILAAGDNVRVGEHAIPFDQFEATS